MHVFIAGAAGRVGRQLVQYALESGHEVTALIRNTPLPIVHKQLEIIQGDLLQDDQWKRAIFPGTVIVATLNAPKGSKAQIIECTKQLVGVGEQRGAARIIILGGGGSLWMADNSLRLEQRDFPEIFKESAAAHLRASHVVEQSTLGWTVFCPPDIKDGQRTGKYRTQSKYRLDHYKWISIQDLADAMLKSIEMDTFLQTRVAISY
jgi:putative NADH-flavin reductase